MAEFEVNAERIDPYKNFKFKVKWDGDYVAGVSKVSPLKRTTHVISHRSGGDPGTARKSVGQTDYEPITLERGITHDESFEKWANQVWSYPDAEEDTPTEGNVVKLASFRKDITIEMYNVAGQLVLSYNLYRCWPSEFVAVPELDSAGNAVAIQTLTLQNEGWDRDEGTEEPEEVEAED
ncbi:MAG: phage tail protein [Proteobacteria bacterium]|nr:phage tail protein [Pseudomonadota bacterium]